MLGIWFKMKKKKNPHIDSLLPLFFLINLLEEAFVFLKPWSSDIHTLHLLPHYFSILNLQEPCHRQLCDHTLSLSLQEFHASPPLALLPSSQEFPFTWLREFPFFSASCFYVSSHSSWLIILPTLMPLAIISTLPIPALVWATDPIVKLSTRHLQFMSLGYVKCNSAKSELVLS